MVSKKAIDETAADDAVPAVELIGAADVEPGERLASMLEAASSIEGATVRVYKLGSDRKKYAFCRAYQVDEFESGGDLELVRSTFGHGSYAIHVYGAKGLLSRTVLEIAEIPVVTNPSTAVADNNSSQLIQTILDGQRVLMEKLAAPPPVAPVVDPMIQMQTMLLMMKTLKEVMATNDTAKPASQLSETLQLMAQLKEAARDLLPSQDGGSETSLLGLGSQVLDLVKQSQRQGNQAIVPVQVPVSIGNQQLPLTDTAPDIKRRRPVGTTKTSIPPKQDEKTPMIKELEDLLAQALVLAATNDTQSAEQAAELLYERLPDELLDLIHDPNWFQILSNVAPQVIAHQTWLTSVVDYMRIWDCETDTGDGDENVAKDPPT